MNLKRVVVTGLGSLTPIGNTVSEYWKSLLEGVSGAGLITRFDTSLHKTKFACEIKAFNSDDYFDRKESRKLDLYAQYGIVAASEAIEDSALNLEKVDKDRVGVIWSSGIGGIKSFEEECSNFAINGAPRFNPFFITKMIADICAGHISIKYGFCGPNYATVSACASSANAIVDAYNLIRLNKADVFVAGGSESPITNCGVGGFNAMHALSVRNDDPKTASRPFDKDRDGFVMAEGAGALVLEEYEHAIARGAKIYAEIVGAGLSADAYHMTASHPEGKGAMLAMKSAVEESGLRLEDVDHINTHGTSTPVGDISEPKAVERLFGEHAYKITLNSTKSMTGHLLGAAGAAEAIATILAVKNKPTYRKVNFALSNTFGFGGHNVCVAFKKYE